jgi:hypothetical protein
MKSPGIRSSRRRSFPEDGFAGATMSLIGEAGKASSRAADRRRMA